MSRGPYSSTIGRMAFKLEKSLPTEEGILKSLHAISMYVVAKTKLNIRRQKIVDSGRLMNSIKYEIYRSDDKTYGTLIGSFGIKYAAMNEFGGFIRPNQFRAIMAAVSRRTVAKDVSNPKVLYKSGTGWRWKARPYLRPAIVDSQKFILETLRREL